MTRSRKRPLEQLRLALEPVGVVHQRVVAQRVEVERDAAVAGEGHLAGGGEEAAVGTVVVGEQQVRRAFSPAWRRRRP
jgi:hypothetical protein